MDERLRGQLADVHFRKVPDDLLDRPEHAVVRNAVHVCAVLELRGFLECVMNPEYADIPESEVVHHAEELGIEVAAVYQLEKRLLGIERRDHGAPAEDFRS